MRDSIVEACRGLGSGTCRPWKTMNCSSCFTRYVKACTLFRREILHRRISIRQSICNTSRHNILPSVDAAIENAPSLLGSTLTTCRLFTITLHLDRIRMSGLYGCDLRCRTLILLLRHAAQAVEMWWRGAVVDFVESTIASDFFLR